MVSARGIYVILILLITMLISAVFAGCTPRGASPPTVPPEAGQLERPTVGVVLREFEFEPRPLKVKAGKLRFLLMNRGLVEHDFAIPSLEGHNEHDKHLVGPGETRTVELDLAPGTYEAICTIPGHKEAGMILTVEVNS